MWILRYGTLENVRVYDGHRCQLVVELQDDLEIATFHVFPTENDLTPMLVHSAKILLGRQGFTPSSGDKWWRRQERAMPLFDPRLIPAWV